MQPFDPHEKDPQGFYSSLAIICGLVALGALANGAGATTVLIVGAVAVACWILSNRTK
jgi:hypothetical protein